MINVSPDQPPTSSEIQPHWLIAQSLKITIDSVCDPLWFTMSAVKNKQLSDYNSPSALQLCFLRCRIVSSVVLQSMILPED